MLKTLFYLNNLIFSVCCHIQFDGYTWRNLAAVAAIAVKAKTFSHIVVAPARCSIVTCCFSWNRTNVKISKVTTISRVVYHKYANFINVITKICYQNLNRKCCAWIFLYFTCALSFITHNQICISCSARFFLQVA